MSESPLQSPCQSRSFSLFWGSGSMPCWRVMICLEEKGLREYDSKQLSFLNEEHKSEQVVDINPRGQVAKYYGICKQKGRVVGRVSPIGPMFSKERSNPIVINPKLPAFKHDDVILNESLGICHYLEDMFPNKGTKLLPGEPKEKALALQRVYEALTLQKKQGELFYYLLYTPADEVKQDVMTNNKKELIKELQLWENYLQKHKGDFYLTGDNFTMADAVFFPLLAIIIRTHPILGETFPLMADYYSRLSQRKSIQDTWPPHWKEVDGQDLLDENFDPHDFDVTRFIG